MHNTILGMIALLGAIYCFITRKATAGLGLLLVALALGFSFLILIKSLPVDIIGVGLTILFAAGCILIIYELRRSKKA